MEIMTLEDEGGWESLEEGADFYNEAMTYRNEADHDKRIACFKAAEKAYLRAAEKGNTIAFANLGYIYSYDRCEGDYADPRDNDPLNRSKHAFECFKIAAEDEDADACYKLGDMFKRGTGCTRDDAKAFKCYLKAYELAEYEEPYMLGSAAQRLGDAYEHGRGCEQDYRKALDYYEQAEASLDEAVSDGEYYYTKVLKGVRASIARLKQSF